MLWFGEVFSLSWPGFHFCLLFIFGLSYKHWPHLSRHLESCLFCIFNDAVSTTCRYFLPTSYMTVMRCRSLCYVMVWVPGSGFMLVLYRHQFVVG